MAESTSSSFELLDERIQRFIWAEGWESLRDAQEAAIPLILKDLSENGPDDWFWALHEAVAGPELA